MHRLERGFVLVGQVWIDAETLQSISTFDFSPQG